MHTPAGKDSEKATAPPYDHALGKQSASAEDPPAATGASGDSMVWGAVAVASVCSLMYLTAVVVYFAKGEVDWSGVPYGIVLFASRNCVCVLVYYICCGIALMVGLSHADISAIHAPRGAGLENFTTKGGRTTRFTRQARRGRRLPQKLSTN